ncbi:hypothetical protein RFI_23668 [Reticulomyxa filosa]|uniref:Uncharacterized protein n=1 Tax=Reticulomyxa filosa TaxID=46433 RepID=X6MKU5_RETFI|nr:hypothetical protein RFI_23668 [Reticulomyxa filosa]|eukprot:ETO13700.1 hypothetical protein RFI_23668 [Reticulomyxa filosa]
MKKELEEAKASDKYANKDKRTKIERICVAKEEVKQVVQIQKETIQQTIAFQIASARQNAHIKQCAEMVKMIFGFKEAEDLRAILNQWSGKIEPRTQKNFRAKGIGKEIMLPCLKDLCKDKEYRRMDLKNEIKLTLNRCPKKEKLTQLNNCFGCFWEKGIRQFRANFPLQLTGLPTAFKKKDKTKKKSTYVLYLNCGYDNEVLLLNTSKPIIDGIITPFLFCTKMKKLIGLRLFPVLCKKLSRWDSFQKNLASCFSFFRF